MTTEQEAAPVPEVPVMFHGREIFARMPSVEQLLVWERTVKRLSEAPIDATWTGQEVMATLERLRKIIDTLISPADVNWLDDQFLDKKLTFRDLTPMVTQIMDAFVDADEKAGDSPAEAPKPAKKAARKKATPK